MKRTEFQDYYPNLHRLLNTISFDSDMPMGEEITFPPEVDLKMLEFEASKLAPDQYELMSIGEEEARNSLVEAKQLQMLDNFLLQAFDGEYAEGIWE